MIRNLNRTWLLLFGIILVSIWIKIGLLVEQVMVIPSPNHNSRKFGLRPINKSVNFFNKPLHGKGVIVSVTGGLGNQLFQFACSFALARDRNCKLYNYLNEHIVISSSLDLDSRKFLPVNRDYVLDKFQIPLNNFIDKSTVINKATLGYINDAQILFRNYSERPFLQLAARSYCVTERYWSPYKDDILAMFQLRPEVVQEFPPYVTMIRKEIERSYESVAVHVRRGDYLVVPGFDIPISFQRSAVHRIIRILRERQNGLLSKIVSTSPTFFVFSDDIDYARDNLEDLDGIHSVKFVFVSSSPTTTENRTTTSLQDFYLMTKCKHFIIPPSTFSWWAAYSSLEQNDKSKSGRIVIASTFNPSFWKKWGTQKETNFYRMTLGQMYFPREWIVINPFIGHSMSEPMLTV